MKKFNEIEEKVLNKISGGADNLNTVLKNSEISDNSLTVSGKKINAKDAVKNI